MKTSEHWHAASDGKKLFYRRFLPDGPVRAVVQVLHGVSEHSARYAPLAEALTGEGYAVYVDDHRGHGKTGEAVDELGWFDGGAARVKADMLELGALAKAERPGLPFCLFGHSMGSMFAQSLIETDGDKFTCAVLSATAGKPPPIAVLGLGVARLAIWRRGPRGTSRVIRALSFDSFNKPFKKDGPTNFEWLSRDRREVEKYAADTFCGFDASNELWLQLLQLLMENARPENRARIPKALPLYLLSGTEDMANMRAASIRELYAGYQSAGLRDVTLKLYEGGRHEMLNETNREEVHRDLLAWLKPRLSAQT